MAKNTFQYKQTISVNRESFMDKVVLNEDLNKKALRVLLHLLTHLDSMTPKEVSVKNIAYELNIDKKDVTRALDDLEIYEVIEKRSTGSVKDGIILLF